MYAKLALAAGAALLTATCFAIPGSTALDEEQQVQQAVTQFYSSLNSLFAGEVAPMEQIWSHADDVTYLGPMGGLQVGWPQVRAVWQQQARLKLGGQIEPHDQQVILGNDLAIVQCYEIGGNANLQGEHVAVSIRATNVFRKERGEWKMISHHTDLIGQLQEIEKGAKTAKTGR